MTHPENPHPRRLSPLLLVLAPIWDRLHGRRRYLPGIGICTINVAYRPRENPSSRLGNWELTITAIPIQSGGAPVRLSPWLSWPLRLLSEDEK